MMKKSLKRFLACGMVTALALGISACGAGKKNEDTIILGYIGPLTGESAIWGQVESCTVQMLVDETNSNGGILGKQVELKIYDNRGGRRGDDQRGPEGIAE